MGLQAEAKRPVYQEVSIIARVISDKLTKYSRLGSVFGLLVC